MSEDGATSSESDPDLRSQVLLSMVPGVGPKLLTALVDRFGTASDVLMAAPSDLRSVPGVGAKVSRAIVEAVDSTDVDAELRLCREHGIGVLTRADPRYPRALEEIHDPPGVLYVRGELQPSDAVAVAIVGTRHATQYGKTQAERLAAALARAGVVIVSGMARGIDGVAHRGALSAQGRTIAVLGSGLLNIYPPEHKGLAEEIAACGAVISESPPRRPAMGGSFPQRNRLISGLSLGVIVVEASVRSGALITARHAMEQGRDVFAVPGRIDSRMSQGPHRLLRDGAKLVETVDDVLEELGPLVQPALDEAGHTVHKPAELLLNEHERTVLDVIETHPRPIDDVVTDCGLPPGQVLSTLAVLEMRRLVRRAEGNRIARI